MYYNQNKYIQFHVYVYVKLFYGYQSKEKNEKNYVN